MTNDLFKRQLASYAAVHRDRRNKATHFIGIPVIVFSLLLVLTLWRLQLGGREVSGAARCSWSPKPWSLWGSAVILPILCSTVT